MELLLGAGAEVAALDSGGWDALLHAAAGDHGAVVQRLLAAGAGVATADPSGRTALHWAAQNGAGLAAAVLVDAMLDASLDLHTTVGVSLASMGQG